MSVATDALSSALAHLKEAEEDADSGSPSQGRLHAIIGNGYAVLAQTSQLHLSNMIAQYQAMCTLMAAGLSTDALITDMKRLEAHIQKGLGL